MATDGARDWLANAGYDPDLGARPLRRVIQRTIEDPLALTLLKGGYSEGDTVTVDVGEGGLEGRALGVQTKRVLDDADIIVKRQERSNVFPAEQQHDGYTRIAVATNGVK